MRLWALLVIIPAYTLLAKCRLQDESQLEYLETFGYLNQAKTPPGVQLSSSARTRKISAAIRKFQSFAGLEATGILDSATRDKMKAPRCGVSDRRPIGGIPAQRNPAMYRWKKDRITWALGSTSARLDFGETRSLMTKAFAAWARHIPVVFVEVPRGASADIRISFGRRQHGDLYPFDGRSGILAHAMYPEDGRIHFDDDELWTAGLTEDRATVDVLTVAVHEIGHSLGLFHSRDRAAIMAPFYQTFQDVTKLQRDDKIRIQDLYGKRRKAIRSTLRPRRTSVKLTTTTPTPPTATAPPRPKPRSTRRPRLIPRRGKRTRASACPARVTALANDVAEPSAHLFFEGSRVFRYREGKSLERLHIDALFRPEAPTAVTAALGNARTTRMLLFSGRLVYAYDRSDKVYALVEGFPKTLGSDVPFAPSAAFVHDDGNQILVEGSRFVSYDENWNLATMAPRSTSAYFPSLPQDAGAVARRPDGTLLAVVGERLHRGPSARSANRRRRIHPQRLGDYLGC